MGKLYYKQLMILLIVIIHTGLSINAQTIAISAGYEHSLFLCNSNTTLGCGKNNISGTLGDGTTVPYRLTPVEQPGLTGITAVAAGAFHSLFLKNDGTVWACGNNGGGQLGDGSNTNATVAVQVSGLNGITAIAAGYFYSLFLKNDGTVWACGDNSYGQLGDGTNTSSNTPVQVTGLSGITAIAAGWYHSLFLQKDGTVWSCGGNSNGQLGDGTNADANTPVQVSDLTGITAVSCGYGHSLFLKGDGTAWSCGYNQYGQLGNTANTAASTPVQVAVTDVTAISAGTMHSSFLKNDGTAVACGLNQSGRLGDGTTDNANTPVPVAGLSGIIAVAAGGFHSLFLKNDGTAWSCGFNSSGQLGNGSAINYSTSIAVQITGLCMPYTYYFDGDGDGYGKENSTTTSNSSIPPAGYAASAGDCNDGNATVHPGATEICGDGIDNNCDGQIDEGCSVTYTYYGDYDGDGYGKTADQLTSSSPTPPPNYSAIGGDCNDGDATVHPGATEICGDGIDNNCDGQIDEGCSVSYTYYFDGDGDGYGKTNSPITSTNPTPPAGYAKLGGDCNDGNATVHPGATEICGDGIDNNCDGQIDEGCTVTTSYHLSTTSTGHGTIGTKMTFTADAGYHIADIQIDGSSLGAITSYTFSNMTADHAVNAIFAVNTFSVTATATTNGTISPAGSTIVNYGGNLTYTITPNTGYHTTQVTIDGSPVGAVGSYTFTNVIRNHTIKASFAINAYTIVSSAGGNGTITPNGSVSVNYVRQ